MRNILRLVVLCQIFLYSASVNALAYQDTQEIKISRTNFVSLPKIDTSYILVEFTHELDGTHPENLKAPNITVEISGAKANVVKIETDLDAIHIFVDLSQIKLTGKESYTVCFGKLFFLDGQGKSHETTKKVCETGNVLLGPDAIEAKLKEMLEKLDETPKTSTEKNIFASGFTAKGEGAKTEGGAEINLNSPDLGIPGLTTSLHLKKSTAEKADPKAFDLGLTYRTLFIFGRKQIEDLRTSLARGDFASATTAKNEIRKKILGSVLFDFTGKLEGEALNFAITNFIGEGMVQVQSRTLKPFNSDYGFFKFRLIPGGIEGGKNLNKGNETQQMGSTQVTQNLKDVDYIARFKFGGVLTLFYNNPSNSWIFKRIEIDLSAVDRYLFKREVMFDQTTMKNTTADKGHKPWYQADLKFYFTDTPSGRFGFKLGYNRGSLPPAFAETRSFQFGFVIETADDGKKIK